MMLKHTVTRLRPKLVRNPYSGKEELGGWDTADSMLIKNVAVAPAFGGVSGSGFQWSEDRLEKNLEAVIYSRTPVDILKGDRVLYNGTAFYVATAPEQWVSPFTGKLGGFVIGLRGV